MDTIQGQIRELQATVKELRERLDALQRGDATFGTITCKGWKVVDTDGKSRIYAYTREDGDAGVMWRDKDWKVRICAVTLPDGTAGLVWRNKGGKVRINAGTKADGTVIYPTRNGK